MNTTRTAALIAVLLAGCVTGDPVADRRIDAALGIIARLAEDAARRAIADELAGREALGVCPVDSAGEVFVPDIVTGSTEAAPVKRFRPSRSSTGRVETRLLPAVVTARLEIDDRTGAARVRLGRRVVATLGPRGEASGAAAMVPGITGGAVGDEALDAGEEAPHLAAERPERLGLLLGGGERVPQNATGRDQSFAHGLGIYGGAHHGAARLVGEAAVGRVVVSESDPGEHVFDGVAGLEHLEAPKRHESAPREIGEPASRDPSRAVAGAHDDLDSHASESTTCEATGSPAIAAPARLWPPAIRPLDRGRLPRQRDATSREAHQGWPEERSGWWSWIDVEARGGVLFVAYTEGLQVWRIDGPGLPRRGSIADIYSGHWGPDVLPKGESKHFVLDLETTADGSLVAAAGFAGIGPSLWSWDGAHLRQVYRDVMRHAEVVSIAGDYVIASGAVGGGMAIYSITSARAGEDPLVGTRPEPYRWVDALDRPDALYLAVASPGPSAPLRILRVARPVTAATFAGAPAVYTGTEGSIHAPRWIEHGGVVYLALVRDDRATVRETRLYRVPAECLSAAGCPSLGPPTWTAPVPPHWGAALHSLTVSEDGGRVWLYRGLLAAGGPRGPAIEALYDITPALDGTGASVEVTAGGPSEPGPCGDTDYWSHYYQFRDYDPRAAVVAGGRVYRAAGSVLDAHVLTLPPPGEPEAPGLIHADGFESGDLRGWRR